jgi:hypothetical protein
VKESLKNGKPFTTHQLSKETNMKAIITQALITQCNEAICFAKRRQTTAMQLMAEEVLQTCSNIADHCGLIDVNQLINKAQIALENGEYNTLFMPTDNQVTSIEKQQLVKVEHSEIAHLNNLFSDLKILQNDAQNANLMLVSKNGLSESSPQLQHMPAVTKAIIDFCEEGKSNVMERVHQINGELDLFGNPCQLMGITCPGCQTELTTTNAGGYRCYCEECVAVFPAFPDNQSLNGYVLQGVYPSFTWVESREYIPVIEKTGEQDNG